MAKYVVGLFDDQNDAHAASHALQDAGFSGDTASVLTSAGGGLMDNLANAGIPQDDAMIYAEGIQRGGALITVMASTDAEANRAAEVLSQYNIVDIDSRRQRGSSTSTGYSSTTQTTQTTGYDRSSTGATTLEQGGEIKVPIVEEELQIGKREVQGGGVRVNTRIEEVPVSEQVTVRDERIDIHRKPVDREVTQADLANIQEGAFEVRERDEEVVVNKQARVVEEVVIGKDVQQRTENIQDTVRRTDVDVQQVPGQTRTTGYTETSGTTGYTESGSTSGTASNEGVIERGASKLGSAAERATGADLDQDGDVGQRDPRNNY